MRAAGVRITVFLPGPLNVIQGNMMLRIGVAVALVALAVGGCSPASEPKGESAPTSAQDSSIQYDDLVFFAQENGRDGSSWRWMGQEGVIRLRNTHRDMVLTIKGKVPTDIPQPPTIGIEFNGEQLDRVVGALGDVEKTYDIPTAKQGSGDWSQLRLTASPTFMKAPDPRHLGFALYNLSWRPK